MDILVVDDSAAMRLMVVRAIRQAGFSKHQFRQAGDGAEALAAIRETRPDIVLADWNMPNMTGIELLEALAEEGDTPTFGFITTESSVTMRQQATAAGAKFMIAKPFTPEAFEKALSPYLD